MLTDKQLLLLDNLIYYKEVTDGYSIEKIVSDILNDPEYNSINTYERAILEEMRDDPVLSQYVFTHQSDKTQEKLLLNSIFLWK